MHLVACQLNVFCLLIINATSTTSSTHRESAANINSDPRQQHEKHSKKEKRMSEELSQTGETGRTMFELFRTFDGEEYTVYMRDDGKRFYVDFEEQVYTFVVIPAICSDFGILLYLHMHCTMPNFN